jgi:hypothetical protein
MKLHQGQWSHTAGKSYGAVALHSPSAFVPLGSVSKQTVAQVQAAGKAAGLINRPTRHSQPGVKNGASAGAAAPGAGSINIPHVPSLPINTGSGYAAKAVGLTAYWQEATHGYVVTPPDQALAVNGTQTLEAVNSVLLVMDQNFGHALLAEPLEALFAPGLASTGYDTVSDPRALYDGATGRWYITVIAYDPTLTIPGSAVLIAVSNTSDAQGTYNIYVLDTSFDGTVCTGDGCLGDQPTLGNDRFTLDISTNSFDWDTGVLNGSQLYVIDKTALALGVAFPSFGYADVGGGTSYPGFLGNSCGEFNPGISAGFCLASLQPSITPGMSYVNDHGGTEFMMQSLDPLGSVDNRVVFWALTNTQAVNSFISSLELSFVVVTTATYGYPLTDHCQIMPQMQYFTFPPFGIPPSTAQCGFAAQPAGGNTPFCDWYLANTVGVTGGCEPGAIQANDDRMNPTTAVKAGNSPATVWSGITSDALVPDHSGVLHRNDVVLWFSLSATGFTSAAPGADVTGAKVNGQGYLANSANDILFPSIAVATNGTSAAIGYTITGNNNFPSVGASKFTVHATPTSLSVAVQGQDVLDDFCNDVPICGFLSTDPNTTYRPRYGDYSMAASWGNDLYVAGETTSASCDDTTFLFTDGTCTGDPKTARGFGSNWATGLVKIHTS